MDHLSTGKRSFSGDSKWIRRKERLATECIRIATYSIILFTSIIFLTIIYKGSKVVLAPSYPFINTSFLTDKPETLHVYKPRQIEAQLIEANLRRVELEQRRSPYSGASQAELVGVEAAIKSLLTELSALEAQSRRGELLFSDSEFRALQKKPPLGDYTYENYAYSAGGIGPAIVGTCLLVLGSISLALLLGIPSAIYLSEYSRGGRMLRWIRLAVLNLAGVPSIVYGLFGFGLFVLFLNWGVSLIAGWFTLALMALPFVIVSSEEALKAIPHSFREGSLALGANKWTSIRTNVLPYALPGILTSSILSIARVAGETAPIMFTAAYALRDQLPWEGLESVGDFFFQGVMALPYHIYVTSAKLPQNDYTEDMQYGAVFVFMLLVGSLTLTSILLRGKIEKQQRW